MAQKVSYGIMQNLVKKVGMAMPAWAKKKDWSKPMTDEENVLWSAIQAEVRKKQRDLKKKRDARDRIRQALKDREE